MGEQVIVLTDLTKQYGNFHCCGSYSPAYSKMENIRILVRTVPENQLTF